MSRSKSKPRRRVQAANAEELSRLPRALFERLGLPVLIVLAGVAAYANSLVGAFVFDDTYHILSNARIQQLWPLDDILFEARRPVVELTLAVNYALGEFDPAGYHALNLFVHVLAALTLFGVVRRTFLSDRLRDRFAGAAPWLAFFTAVIWVVHPLQTQAVTYIIQRGESLMGLFYLLTLYGVIRGANAPRAARWYVMAVIACVLGMGSKAVMVTAPVVVLVFDWVFLAKTLRELARRRWSLYLGLAATWLVLVGVGVVGGVLSTDRPHANVGFSTKQVSSFEFLRSQPGVLLHYLRLSIWPHPLCFDYGWPIAQSWGRILVQAAVIGLSGLATLLALVRKSPWGFVGFWFFAILAPTSSFIPIRDLAFEHRMYLSLASIIVLLVVGAYIASRRFAGRGAGGVRAPQVIGAVAAALAVVILAVRTYERNKDYSSELALWDDVVAQRPDNPRGRYSLANALLKAGRLDEAVAQSHEAIRLRPDDAPTYFDLGAALYQQGKVEEARAAYHEAIRLEPDMSRARLNLGVLLYREGDIEGAVREYRETLRVDPDHVLALNNLGNALKRLGRLEEAVEAYRKVVEIEPRHIDARMKIGDALVSQGDTEAAIREYRAALKFSPGHPDVNFRLGISLMQLERFDEAIAAIEQTLRAKPDNPAAQQALAAAKAQRGR